MVSDSSSSSSDSSGPRAKKVTLSGGRRKNYTRPEGQGYVPREKSSSEDPSDVSKLDLESDCGTTSEEEVKTKSVAKAAEKIFSSEKKKASIHTESSVGSKRASSGASSSVSSNSPTLSSNSTTLVTTAEIKNRMHSMNDGRKFQKTMDENFQSMKVVVEEKAALTQASMQKMKEELMQATQTTLETKMQTMLETKMQSVVEKIEQSMSGKHDVMLRNFEGMLRAIIDCQSQLNVMRAMQDVTQGKSPQDTRRAMGGSSLQSTLDKGNIDAFKEEMRKEMQAQLRKEIQGLQTSPALMATASNSSVAEPAQPSNSTKPVNDVKGGSESITVGTSVNHNSDEPRDSVNHDAAISKTCDEILKNAGEKTQADCHSMSDSGRKVVDAALYVASDASPNVVSETAPNNADVIVTNVAETATDTNPNSTNPSRVNGYDMVDTAQNQHNLREKVESRPTSRPKTNVSQPEKNESTQAKTTQQKSAPNLANNYGAGKRKAQTWNQATSGRSNGGFGGFPQTHDGGGSGTDWGNRSNPNANNAYANNAYSNTTTTSRATTYSENHNSVNTTSTPKTKGDELEIIFVKPASSGTTNASNGAPNFDENLLSSGHLHEELNAGDQNRSANEGEAQKSACQDVNAEARDCNSRGEALAIIPPPGFEYEAYFNRYDQLNFDAGQRIAADWYFNHAFNATGQQVENLLRRYIMNFWKEENGATADQPLLENLAEYSSDYRHGCMIMRAKIYFGLHKRCRSRQEADVWIEGREVRSDAMYQEDHRERKSLGSGCFNKAKGNSPSTQHKEAFRKACADALAWMQVDLADIDPQWGDLLNGGNPSNGGVGGGNDQFGVGQHGGNGSGQNNHGKPLIEFPQGRFPYERPVAPLFRRWKQVLGLGAQCKKEEITHCAWAKALQDLEKYKVITPLTREAYKKVSFKFLEIQRSFETDIEWEAAGMSSYDGQGGQKKDSTRDRKKLNRRLQQRREAQEKLKEICCYPVDADEVKTTQREMVQGFPACIRYRNGVMNCLLCNEEVYRVETRGNYQIVINSHIRGKAHLSTAGVLLGRQQSRFVEGMFPPCVVFDSPRPKLSMWECKACSLVLNFDAMQGHLEGAKHNQRLSEYFQKNWKGLLYEGAYRLMNPDEFDVGDLDPVYQNQWLGLENNY